MIITIEALKIGVLEFFIVNMSKLSPILRPEGISRGGQKMLASLIMLTIVQNFLVIVFSFQIFFGFSEKAEQDQDHARPRRTTTAAPKRTKMLPQGSFAPMAQGKAPETTEKPQDAQGQGAVAPKRSQARSSARFAAI